MCLISRKIALRIDPQVSYRCYCLVHSLRLVDPEAHEHGERTRARRDRNQDREECETGAKMKNPGSWMERASYKYMKPC